jgi:hypothetical protein
VLIVVISLSTQSGNFWIQPRIRTWDLPFYRGGEGPVVLLIQKIFWERLCCRLTGGERADSDRQKELERLKSRGEGGYSRGRTLQNQISIDPAEGETWDALECDGQTNLRPE